MSNAPNRSVDAQRFRHRRFTAALANVTAPVCDIVSNPKHRRHVIWIFVCVVTHRSPPATRHRGLTAVFCPFRRQDRIEHDLRIGRLRKRLRHFVAMIALVRVVAAKFFQERNDFRRFLLAEDREF